MKLPRHHAAGRDGCFARNPHARLGGTVWKPRIQGLSLLTSGSARPLLWSVVPKHKRRKDLLDYSRGACPSPHPNANFLEFFLPVSYSLHVKIIHANFMHFAQRHLIRQISSSTQ